MLMRLLGFCARLLGGGRNRDEGPRASLLLLTTRPPAWLDDEVAGAVRRALPISGPEILESRAVPPPEHAPDAEDARLLPVVVNRAVFAVLLAPFRFTDAAEPMELHHPADYRNALEQHRGWVALDHLTGDADEPYSVIGHIAAELMDDSVCLLCLPTLGLAALPSPQLVESMRKGVWLQHFIPTAADRTHADPADDPGRRRAADRARLAWDAFVEAFKDRRGEHFSAKFPFVDGPRVEHLWITVTAMDGSSVRGTIANEPSVLTNICEGDAVERHADELEDWLFMRNGALFGGFSLRAIMGEPEL
ncbi:MAG: hypothetical protein Kow0022_05730 [Phycisphaerales bacterium]